MKKKPELLNAALSALGLMVLILDGKTALDGARQGVELCLNTLVPTLLPFFFLSNILTAGLMGRKIAFLRPIGRLCRISEGAEYILLTGFLGGYPLGAQCISQACERKVLSYRDGRRMLAFCNNCGPAFIFGVSAALFQDPKIPWLLFSIHIISAIFVAIWIPGEPGRCIPDQSNPPSAVETLWSSLRSMAGVCGWVILFRVILEVSERWLFWYFPKEIQISVAGILELSNGCISLNGIDSEQLRFVLCAGFLAFGGLCVVMQTYSAASNIDRGLYFPGKMMHSFISLTLACLISNPKWALFPTLAAIITGIFLRKWEIRCRNPRKLVV